MKSLMLSYNANEGVCDFFTSDNEFFSLSGSINTVAERVRNLVLVNAITKEGVCLKTRQVCDVYVDTNDRAGNSFMDSLETMGVECKKLKYNRNYIEQSEKPNAIIIDIDTYIDEEFNKVINR